MSGIKTVHINDQSTWRGGEQQVFFLLKGLLARDHRAELIAQPGSVINERARAAGIKTHEIRMWGEADILAAKNIGALIKKGQFDIVHMHTSHAHMLGCAACTFNPDPLCIVSRRVDFPVKKHALSLSRWKYKFRVDHYIAISEAVKDVLIQGGVSAEKISIVHSGVEAPDSSRPLPDIKTEFGLKPGSKIVGNVGALVDHKGQRYLIEAAPSILQEVPETTFLIIGDGELRDNLKSLASQLGVENAIIFAGFRADARLLLSQFDLFVAPSHMEGLNTSIIDAMMAARPVVAARAGGIPELIQHESTGLLVPPRNPEALAKAIVELLKDSEKGKALAKQAREKAMAEFSADRMTDGTIAAYERLLSKR